MISVISVNSVVKNKAILLALVLFAAYNANGREIPSFDSQPTKFAARELLLRGTLSLNHVVGLQPAYGERAAFVTARDGRIRSAYSPLPSVIAAAIAWPLWKTGCLDVRAPLAPNVIAALTASLLAALAVTFAYLTARRFASDRAALTCALLFGLGTGLWSTVSQTLWQHETAAIGLAVAMWLLFGWTEGGAKEQPLSLGRFVLAGLMLGIAGAARPQVAPLIAVLTAAAFATSGRSRGLLVALPVIACAAAVAWLNIRWFGGALGPMPFLESQHASVHYTNRSFGSPFAGLAGLLVSPSRGLLIFSPIVLLVIPVVIGPRSCVLRLPSSTIHHPPSSLGASLGPQALFRHPPSVIHHPFPWLAIAAVAQLILYSTYSVWWGGHTYGPRYLCDILLVVLPLAAAGYDRVVRSRVGATLVAVFAAWSVLLAATGAFCYPAEAWNTDPVDVDRAHERLWDWSDPQFVRCWHQGLSPQNFQLFTRGAWRIE